MSENEASKMARLLAELERQARGYLADAMREPSESYPPVFATYVEQGVETGKATVSVDTAIAAIGFAMMDSVRHRQQEPSA